MYGMTPQNQTRSLAGAFDPYQYMRQMQTRMNAPTGMPLSGGGQFNPQQMMQGGAGVPQGAPTGTPDLAHLQQMLQQMQRQRWMQQQQAMTQAMSPPPQQPAATPNYTNPLRRLFMGAGG